jgi:hypothetical protein
MADNTIEILGNHTKKILSKARFYAISTDEVTIVNHESWLSVQIYISIGFCRVPILLSLLQLVEENGIFGVKECILMSLNWHGGLIKNVVAKRLMCFEADGILMFQGYRSNIIQQLKEQDAPFMLGVHCMTHCTNLAVEPLSNLHVVAKLETICQTLYIYFSMSSKKHI